MTDVASLIAAIVTAVVAAIGGLYRLIRDRNTAREAALQKARDEALAQARSEALLREANATIGQLKDEIRSKDTEIAERRIAISELRQALLLGRGRQR
jgi:uncharacterized protein HemX